MMRHRSHCQPCHGKTVTVMKVRATLLVSRECSKRSVWKYNLSHIFGVEPQAQDPDLSGDGNSNSNFGWSKLKPPVSPGREPTGIIQFARGLKVARSPTVPPFVLLPEHEDLLIT
jgi:hypothetical protein